MKVSKKIYILDATLREGYQTIYQNIIPEVSHEYLTCIQNMGIKNIEIRNPYTSTESMENYLILIKEFPDLVFETHMYLNTRNVENFTKNKNIKNVNTFIPYPIRSKDLNLLETFLAQNPDKLFRVSIEKVASLSLINMKKISNIFKRYHNLRRLGLSDTKGELDNVKLLSIIKKIRRYKGFRDVDLELHLHNDRGLALSNALSAIKYFTGKEQDLYISCSMNGLAERNGLPSLGGLIANMIFLKINHGYNFGRYIKLVDLFNRNHIHFDNDPCGSNTFTHSATSHLSQVLVTNSYNLFNPKEIGFSHIFLFNKNTPIDVIMYFLKKNNVILAEDIISSFLDDYFSEKRTTISSSSLIRLVSSL